MILKEGVREGSKSEFERNEKGKKKNRKVIEKKTERDPKRNENNYRSRI